jgi:hypothetical protein
MDKDMHRFDKDKHRFASTLLIFRTVVIISRSPKGEGVYYFTSVRLSVRPSVRPRYFSRIFLSNCWWQKSYIWSQASYRYPISWEAFLDPSDSYFLFADLVDFYTHLTYICICSFFVAFFSATIDGRNLIFGHKLHIGTPYRGKRFWTHQIRTSCLPILLIFIHI